MDSTSLDQARKKQKTQHQFVRNDYSSSASCTANDSKSIKELNAFNVQSFTSTTHSSKIHNHSLSYVIKMIVSNQTPSHYWKSLLTKKFIEQSSSWEYSNALNHAVLSESAQLILILLNSNQLAKLSLSAYTQALFLACRLNDKIILNKLINNIFNFQHHSTLSLELLHTLYLLPENVLNPNLHNNYIDETNLLTNLTLIKIALRSNCQALLVKLLMYHNCHTLAKSTKETIYSIYKDNHTILPILISLMTNNEKLYTLIDACANNHQKTINILLTYQEVINQLTKECELQLSHHINFSNQYFCLLVIKYGHELHLSTMNYYHAVIDAIQLKKLDVLVSLIKLNKIETNEYYNPKLISQALSQKEIEPLNILLSNQILYSYFKNNFSNFVVPVLKNESWELCHKILQSIDLNTIKNYHLSSIVVKLQSNEKYHNNLIQLFKNWPIFSFSIMNNTKLITNLCTRTLPYKAWLETILQHKPNLLKRLPSITLLSALKYDIEYFNKLIDLQYDQLFKFYTYENFRHVIDSENLDIFVFFIEKMPELLTNNSNITKTLKTLISIRSTAKHETMAIKLLNYPNCKNYLVNNFSVFIQAIGNYKFKLASELLSFANKSKFMHFGNLEASLSICIEFKQEKLIDRIFEFHHGDYNIDDSVHLLLIKASKNNLNSTVKNLLHQEKVRKFAHKNHNQALFNCISNKDFINMGILLELVNVRAAIAIKDNRLLGLALDLKLEPLALRFLDYSEVVQQLPDNHDLIVLSYTQKLNIFTQKLLLIEHLKPVFALKKNALLTQLIRYGELHNIKSLLKIENVANAITDISICTIQQAIYNHYNLSINEIFKQDALQDKIINNYRTLIITAISDLNLNFLFDFINKPNILSKIIVSNFLEVNYSQKILIRIISLILLNEVSLNLKDGKCLANKFSLYKILINIRIHFRNNDLIIKKLINEPNVICKRFKAIYGGKFNSLPWDLVKKIMLLNHTSNDKSNYILLSYLAKPKFSGVANILELATVNPKWSC